jgi:GntR family transcriptional regulator
LLQDVRTIQECSPDKPLPSETELTKQYKVSRVTIRQALKELERMGVIYRQKGKGSFVTRPRLKGFSGFGSFTTQITNQGLRPSSKILDFQIVESLPLEMTEHFHLSPEAIESDQFIFLKRLRFVNDKPVAIEDAYLPQALFPGLEKMEFGQNQSLVNTVVEYWGVNPIWAEALIESVAASPTEAELLKISPRDPLLVAWRISLTETDQALNYVKSVYRGNQYVFNLGRHRIE